MKEEGRLRFWIHSVLMGERKDDVGSGDRCSFQKGQSCGPLVYMRGAGRGSCLVLSPSCVLCRPRSPLVLGGECKAAVLLNHDRSSFGSPAAMSGRCAGIGSIGRTFEMVVGTFTWDARLQSIAL